MLLIKSMFIKFFLRFEGSFFIFKFQKAVSLGGRDHFSSFGIGLQFGRVLLVQRDSRVFLPCFSKNFFQFIDLVSLWDVIDDNNVFDSIGFSWSLNDIHCKKISIDKNTKFINLKIWMNSHAIGRDSRISFRLKHFLENILQPKSIWNIWSAQIFWQFEII